MKHLKKILAIETVLIIIFVTVQPAGAEYPDLDVWIHNNHFAAVGGRDATEAEEAEVLAHSGTLQAQFRKQTVQHMLDTVWLRKGIVQRIHEAMLAMEYDPYLNMLYAADTRVWTSTSRDEMEEKLPATIWEDAWYLLQNGWSFGDAQGKENHWAFRKYKANGQDLFLAVYTRTKYAEEYPAYSDGTYHGVFDWDTYTFADGRKADILVEYWSTIRYIDPKKYDVNVINADRTLLGKMKKNGKFELYELVYSELFGYRHFW